MLPHLLALAVLDTVIEEVVITVARKGLSLIAYQQQFGVGNVCQKC